MTTGDGPSPLLRGPTYAAADFLDRIRAKGRTIELVAEGSEELRLLDTMGANANVGGESMTHILLRADPRKIEILEEFLHGTQLKSGVLDALDWREAEAHVKIFMIRHRRLLGIGDGMSPSSTGCSGGLAMIRSDPYTMRIQDIFKFKDGRVVFVGEVDGDPRYIHPGPCEIRVDGVPCGRIRVEGEMLASHGPGHPGGLMRSVSTLSTRIVDREWIALGRWELKSLSNPRGATMHRHLLGVDSPPPEYIADPMTLGPVLPEGWDGDAWVEPRGRGYFLRAWNKGTARVAYGAGRTYEESRKHLLDEVAEGSRRAEIDVCATVGS